MKKQLVTTIGISLLLFIFSSTVTAQIDQNPYGQQTQRSIWDKEPELNTDQPSPFGSNTQRAGTASVQQNGTLADPPSFPGNTQDGVPVDGGLGLLLAAGAGYGIKKIRESRKKPSKKI